MPPLLIKALKHSGCPRVFSPLYLLKEWRYFNESYHN